MMSNQTLSRAAHSRLVRLRGFMLLEALVAILLFSLGILGVVGFQASAAKMTADARYRTEAAMYAEELVARMRVGSRLTLATDYATSGTVLNSWKANRLAKAGEGLPSANVSTRITLDATTGSFDVAITISWLPPGVPTTEQGTYQFQTLALIEP